MITITHDDRTHTIEEWADITGLKAETIYWRYRRGYPPEKIVSTAMYRPNSTMIEIDGKFYSLPEIEHTRGINRRTLAARIARGITNPAELLRPVTHTDAYMRKKEELLYEW